MSAAPVVIVAPTDPELPDPRTARGRIHVETHPAP